MTALGPALHLLNKVVAAANVFLALVNALTDPSVTTLLQAAGGMADFAIAFRQTFADRGLEGFSSEEGGLAFGFTEAQLTAFSGGCIAIYSVLGAGEAATSGDDLGAAGDLVSATGGFVQVLSAGAEGYEVGVIAALLVLAGDLIATYSLDEDDRFLLQFAREVVPSAEGSLALVEQYAEGVADYLADIERELDQLDSA